MFDSDNRCFRIRHSCTMFEKGELFSKVQSELTKSIGNNNLFQNLDIKSYEGARCWNAGWGSSSNDGAWATNLESIGVNLLGKLTCQMRSFWRNLYENEICAVSKPTETTQVNGYGYHVVSGGKETCSGDNGAPLLCDIDGVNTLVGINSRGYDQCGAEGYPAIHVGMNSIQTWIEDIISNQSGIIWSEWSKCDADCKQTRKRSKYESEMRDCKGVCFRSTSGQGFSRRDRSFLETSLHRTYLRIEISNHLGLSSPEIPPLDTIDNTLKTCKFSQSRRKRSAEARVSMK